VGLLSLYFRDAEHGFVAGVGKILRTEDGGATWTSLTSQTHPALGLEIIESVQFPEAGAGFAAGNGKVLRTQDGGLTWQALDTLPHNPLYIPSMHFLDGHRKRFPARHRGPRGRTRVWHHGRRRNLVRAF
jgi:photosystem II stability/assembly factor-like uncharacterized protein